MKRMTERKPVPEETTSSLKNRAALVTGASFWKSHPIGEFPALFLTDGPHGIRAQLASADHLGLAPSEPATCFPPASGLSQSWDVILAARVGQALGTEAAFFGVSVLLGPGVNIRRDPRGGRNFEYFSEDPIHGSELAIAWVQGVQSQGVGASLKHFAANNAETDRMRSDSIIDPRALREIYLRSFERVVRAAKPWTVMCSYNKVNGVSASQNQWLLNDVLRSDWGFDGVVVSDWGAVYDRVEALRAGLDLEMPAGGENSVSKVVSAIESGALPVSSLDAALENLHRLAFRVSQKQAVPADFDANHTLAREAAARSIVLLKNKNNLLPLRADANVAVIGPFAKEPRYQGGGSSHVVPTRVDVPLEQIRAIASSPDRISFSKGFSLGSDSDEPGLIRDAAKAASAADVAVLFLGLSATDESEGFDRKGLRLPEAQLALLAAVVKVQPNTVVFLSHGGTVLLGEVKQHASSVLTGALLGQGGGHAMAAVLYGLVNPSGRLSETVPIRLEDAPSFGNFPGEFSSVLYGESIFVGYRGYDSAGLDVTYPFGFGLSYTDFSYGEVSTKQDATSIEISLEITNSGERDGREVVQFYVGKADSVVRRAPAELKAFSVVELAVGQSKTVQSKILLSDLEHWDSRTNSWAREGGTWTIYAAASSRDFRSSVEVNLQRSGQEPLLSMDSTIAEVLGDPIAGPVLESFLPKPQGGVDPGEVLGIDLVAMMGAFPLRSMSLFSDEQKGQLEALLERANANRSQKK